VAVSYRAVLLAGGAGTRLWPLSTEAEPKQFLRLWGERSLLQDAWDRVRPEASRVCVATADRYASRTRAELPDLAPENLFREPSRRNTAAAIVSAALALSADGDEPVVFLPADQTVGDRGAFAVCLGEAASAAAREPGIVLLGVRPTRPETEYGYVEVEKGTGPRRVRRFVEKPSTETAREYVADGSFLWNAGIFAFRPSSLVSVLERVASELLETCRGYRDRPSAETWERIPEISFDYAVMEKTNGAICVPCEAGWNDVGSYRALRELKGADRSGNLVLSGRPVVLEGVRDSIVAISDAGALVLPFAREGELRDRVARLRAKT